MSFTCPDKTLADVDFRVVREALSRRCKTAAGLDEALALSFGATRGETETRLAEAIEATALVAAGTTLPVGGVPDIRGYLGRIGASGILVGRELYECGQFLLGARAVRRFLTARKDRVARLYEAYATDPSLDPVGEEILGCFDDDGTLADRASPRLKELRSELKNARARLVSRLEELMKKHESIVQDDFMTEREGRWVIPIRSDSHERFSGIVHGTSGSGATLFVEPRAIIPMGNRLKMLEGEALREEYAIYTRLSGLLWEVSESVIAAARALATLDLRFAVAELARERHLHFPEIRGACEGHLIDAKHFVLLERDVNVVPSDLSFRRGEAVVVSGPNAGGKTVALKTIGLCALMLRAGLPIAAAEGSVLSIVEGVLTDVGDDQSLAKDLSTFSAHVQNLGRILESTEPGVLVLLDEIATGTDPREGEALAAGVLDSLLARGGAVVATTHYEGLKALAAADDRFKNASCGFDLSTMTPTFRLHYGVPGRSSALEVARRFGLPSTVIERARGFLSSHDRTFEETVEKLDEQRRAFELAKHAADRARTEHEELSAKLAAELARARARVHEELLGEAETLRARLSDVREQVKLAHRALKGKERDATQMREVERRLERVSTGLFDAQKEAAARFASAPEARAAVDESPIKRGERVFVTRLQAEADVLEVMGDQLRVAAGALKIVVPATDVHRPLEPEAKAPSTRKARSAPPAQNEPAIQTRDNTCDVRGLRTDDALSMVSTFLDRAVGDGTSPIFVIHGHGTGALRDAIRRELKDNRFVHHTRAGAAGEGGDGVTLVWVG